MQALLSDLPHRPPRQRAPEVRHQADGASVGVVPRVGPRRGEGGDAADVARRRRGARAGEAARAGADGVGDRGAFVATVPPPIVAAARSLTLTRILTGAAAAALGVWLGGEPAARLLLSLTKHVGEADVVAAVVERLHGSGLPPHLR